MGLIRRYQFYKRSLQIVVALNMFFIFLGVMASVQYFKTHEASAQDLMIVGFGTLLFGVLLPTFLIAQLTKRIAEMRRQTSQMISQFMSDWLTSFEEFDKGDALHNPKFYLNIVLLLVEAVGDSSRHPAVQLAAEISVALREEIHKATKKSHKSSKKD